MVLTIADRFSKAAHFIPQAKLPFDHVFFYIYWLPRYVVSDRGPQFVSKFWREFCKLLGATVSLSSGFPPEGNSQMEKANQDLERVFGLSEPILQEPATFMGGAHTANYQCHLWAYLRLSVV